MAITLVTLLADSALDLLLIPRLGMQGAALATAISLVLAAVAVVVLARTTVHSPAADP